MLHADYFTTAFDYVAFINDNPNIDLVSTVVFGNSIIVTWKE